MPKLASPLVDSQPQNALPKSKPYKLSDGGGLYLLINTDGTKYWRMDYRFAGIRRTLSLGKYPSVSLVGARKLRTSARSLIDEGKDPLESRQEQRKRDRNEMMKTPKLRFSINEEHSLVIENSNNRLVLSDVQTLALHAFLTATISSAKGE
ncbi:MAG TPA: Arm DNA-binding domain-containing protein [Burkholderiaceae bacterium]|jgi:hypothetical protein|nr:Arm DNA-binding domain-containing protein [Burkholderiaceae bacterium]